MKLNLFTVYWFETNDSRAAEQWLLLDWSSVEDTTDQCFWNKSPKYRQTDTTWSVSIQVGNEYTRSCKVQLIQFQVPLSESACVPVCSGLRELVHTAPHGINIFVNFSDPNVPKVVWLFSSQQVIDLKEEKKEKKNTSCCNNSVIKLTIYKEFTGYTWHMDLQNFIPLPQQLCRG